jgi:hypothetical protein
VGYVVPNSGCPQPLGHLRRAPSSTDTSGMVRPGGSRLSLAIELLVIAGLILVVVGAVLALLSG